MRRYAWRWTILLVLAGCGGDDPPPLTEPEDLLPGDGEVPGWYWDGTSAKATDAASLANLVDGAEEFLELGFVSATCQGYRGTIGQVMTRAEVLVADQGNAPNAKALFDRRLSRHPFGHPVSVGYAEEARLDEATGLDTVVVDFWQRRFYVQVTIANRHVAPDLVRQTALQFAHHVSVAIREAFP